MFSEKLPLSGERPPYLWSSVFFAFSVFLHKKAPLHIEMVKEESTFHAMQPQQKICIGLPIQQEALLLDLQYYTLGTYTIVLAPVHTRDKQ